jgi:AraC-like DNA-binding protein
MTEAEIADICNQLAEGKSLRAICRETGKSESNVRRWIAESDETMAQYAHARELQADVLFDECLAIADGTHETAKADIQERRLQVDTRKWMAGKLRGKYSDKLVVESKSEVTHRYELDGLSTDELDTLERIAAKASIARGDTGGAGTAESPAVH